MPGKTSLGQEPKTEEIKSGFKPVQNSNLGLKPLSGENSNLGLKPLTGGNSLNHKSKTENLDSKSKFEKLFSSPESNSGRNEGENTLEKGDLELANSKILELEEKVKKLRKEIKSLRAENLTLNILYFTGSYSQYLTESHLFRCYDK